MRWDQEAAQKALNFFGHLQHTKGRKFAKKKFQLEPWQAFIVGVVFGWKREDGTRRFRVVFVEVPRKNGKALDVDTPIATVDGWKNHGDLVPGDFVFGPDGLPRMVLANSGSYLGPCREVEFSSGEKIVAHDNHEWETKRSWFTGRKRGERRPLPRVTTNQIFETLKTTGNRKDFVHSIPVACPLQCAEAMLPIPAYTFGIWLGDGTSATSEITTADLEVVQGIQAEGVPIRRKVSSPYAWRLSNGRSDDREKSIQARMRAMGVLGNKRIPVEYQRASVAQRLDLLSGLVDSDGHITKAGQCEITLVDEVLMKDVFELVAGLGYKPTISEADAKIYGRVISRRWRLQFWPGKELPLRIDRKRERLNERIKKRATKRQVVSCDSIGERLVNCIEVEGGMYLAGKSLIPTHNSTLAAGMALYLLMADGEPGAEVYSVATKKEQARIVFDEAKRMVAKSPPIRKRIKPYREELRHTKSESVFKPLSSDSKKLDGLNPHAFVADEVHKYESRDIWDVLDTGTGSRDQPLKIAITTAGTLDEGIYKELRDYTESVLDGVESEDGSAVKDDAFFGYVGTIDEGDDPESPDSWAKANPNWGVTVHKTEMEEAFKRANRTEAGRIRFLRDRVGLRLGSNLGGIPLEKWDRCKFPRLEKEDDKQMQSRFAEELKGQSCHAALDIANTSDLAALCLTFPRMENGLRYYKQLFWFWCPETAKDSVSELLRDILRPWIHAGYIIQAADDQIDLREIKQTLINASRYYDILDCAFDPHNARQLAGELQEEGIPMFEFTQGIANYNEPCKEYESAIRGRRIQHDGNPAMRWQIGNMVFRANGAGYVMPDRKRSRNKIDGVVAAIMSVARAMQSEGPSVYETRGVEVLG